MDKKCRKIGKPSIRLIEECSEVIKAITKAERFGYGNYHPDNAPCHAKPKEKWCDRNGPGGFMGHTCGEPKTNGDVIREEFGDLMLAWQDYLVYKEPSK